MKTEAKAKVKFMQRFDNLYGRRYVIRRKFELQFYKEDEIGLAVLYDKPSATLVFQVFNRSFSIQFWYDDLHERMAIMKKRVEEFYENNPEIDFIPFTELGDLDPVVAEQLEKLGLRQKREQK